MPERQHRQAGCGLSSRPSGTACQDLHQELVASLVPATVAMPQNAPVNASGTDDESKIAGTRRGDSVCVQKGTSCHDEIAVYRIATIPGKRGSLVVPGGKIVDGKEVVMGSGEWRYDSGKPTLATEHPQGVITLKVDDCKIEGTFTLPDKRVLRGADLKGKVYASQP